MFRQLGGFKASAYRPARQQRDADHQGRASSLVLLAPSHAERFERAREVLTFFIQTDFNALQLLDQNLCNPAVTTAEVCAEAANRF